MYDPIEYIRKMEKVGYTREQSETNLRIIYQIADRLVTKDDFKKDLKALENSIVVKLGGMIGGGITILAALKFFT